MKDAVPAELGEIDGIEIVDVHETEPTFPFDGKMDIAEEVSRWPVSGQDAQEIANLFRALAPGMQARCHIPYFGFRFFSKGEVIVAASICFQCNNIYGMMGARKLRYEFEAQEPGARALLLKAKEISGRPSAEDELADEG